MKLSLETDIELSTFLILIDPLDIDPLVDIEAVALWILVPLELTVAVELIDAAAFLILIDPELTELRSAYVRSINDSLPIPIISAIVDISQLIVSITSKSEESLVKTRTYINTLKYSKSVKLSKFPNTDNESRLEPKSLTVLNLIC